jgi:hypothetical protein
MGKARTLLTNRREHERIVRFNGNVRLLTPQKMQCVY